MLFRLDATHVASRLLLLIMLLHASQEATAAAGEQGSGTVQLARHAASSADSCGKGKHT